MPTVAIYYKRQIAWHKQQIEYLQSQQAHWGNVFANDTRKLNAAINRLNENIKSHQRKVECYQGSLADWVQS